MRRPAPMPKLVVPPVSQIEQPSLARPVDLRQTFVESFLAARDLQPKSVRSYRQGLQQFIDWCDLPWTHRPRQISRFKTYLTDDRQLSVNTIRRTLQTLKSFYRWMAPFGSCHERSDPRNATPES